MCEGHGFVDDDDELFLATGVLEGILGAPRLDQQPALATRSREGGELDPVHQQGGVVRVAGRALI
jgi:hypothetical protein